MPAHLLTTDLKRVLLLFRDEPDACFEKVDYAELQSYFTLTRGTIAETTVESTPGSRPAISLDFPVPTLVRIPAGKFLMGTSDEDIKRLVATTDWAKEWQKEDHFKREQPQHAVELKEYRIGKYPVTNAEYRAFVEDKKAKPPQHWSGGNFPDDQAAHPVVSVSWRDAVAYCQWLTEKLRAGGQLPKESEIRLPTEAEWEMAARGTTDARFYPWGDEWDADKCNTSEKGPGSTTPVGQYSPAGDSPFGIADLAGNVWEWTCSVYKRYPYDPKDGREKLEAEVARVLRGGSWLNYAVLARCASRYRGNPDLRYDDFGFRVVASPFVSGR